MINSIEHPSEVYGIALQSHQNENNFATVCPDGIVRLFDTRRNGKGQSRHDVYTIQCIDRCIQC